MSSALGILHFAEHYVERIWGGRRLQSAYGKPLPVDVPIGEAWLVSDHPSAESTVDEGPHTGRSLHDLMQEYGTALLGTAATPTIHGRFPLLLKLLDSTDYLSVQVHPDDACALRLGEPDVGKTEMWHVLQSDQGGQLFCGLDPAATPESLAHAIRANTLESLLPHFAVQPGDSVFVPAGTIHAIGPGLVLAEIQQNSDLTYRLYDWGRVQADGTPRALHIEKSVAATHFGEHHPGKAPSLLMDDIGGRRSLLAACRYFAAERLDLESPYNRQTRHTSFHIILALSGALTVTTESSTRSLAPSEAVLIPAGEDSFTLQGHGVCLDYYVPDLHQDIIVPLRDSGHADSAIGALVHQ
ncbi:MAG: class I mannose-6-phosphate isomerase [Candidatus Hydrogenedentes bacterium]|nr:class I mannose-6-phosphate isomerase [Candidatus Hydrogenedentota bacterium]